MEMHLCGKPNYVLCAWIGRFVRTPNVEVNGFNLRKEVIHFNTLPVPSRDDPDHLLSPPNAREYTETHNLSADDLRKVIPTKNMQAPRRLATSERRG
eukprot:13011917-Ditylum_brightwellii.AAC.1